MKKKKLQVQTVDGPVEANGWYREDTPDGLYALNIEQVLPPKSVPSGAPKWDIVHHTGYTVAIAFESRDQALEAAEWLGGGYPDWSAVSVVEIPIVKRAVIETLIEFGHGAVA